MPGIFSKANRPIRPGAYFNWQAAQQTPNYQGSAGIAALAVQANWGPENVVVPVGDYPSYGAVYGRGQATAGDIAVEGAFRGEGLPGDSGADVVLVYRMVNTSTAVKATVSVSNGATPALPLQAVYYGTYGNRLSYAVMANSRNPTTMSDFVIYDNGTEVERYTYAKTDIAGLAAQITAGGGYLKPNGSVTTGTALTVGTGNATGGLNGTLAPGDYTAALGVIDLQRFSTFAFDDISAASASVLTALLTYVQGANNTGKRFEAVVGGALNEVITDALTRSASLNEPNIINAGVGSVQDSIWGVLSTSQLAPRLAGILCRRGEQRNLTFARLAGTTIIQGASSSDVLQAIPGGVVVLTRDSRPDAPTRIEKGVTSFTSPADPNRPLKIYSVPKFMRTMQGIETEITDFAQFYVIGNNPVNDATRDYLRADAEARLKLREAAGIIQPGWSVGIDTDPPPRAQDEFVALKVGLNFGRSLEQIYFTVTVG